jgi:hypothetical protein
LLRKLRVDPEPALAQAKSDAIKAKLRAETEEAQRLGVFGAPTFVCSDGELFWGNDRLERALAWANSQQLTIHVSRSKKTFTPKQGQYLRFIHLYTRLHRQPPAETDMQEYFRVSPPSVHQMVLTLERSGLIRRKPRTPRSIELLVDPTQLPQLPELR